MKKILLFFMGLMPNWFVWFMAQRYIAGTTREDAFLVAHELSQEGRNTTIDCLGETVNHANQVEAVYEEYEALVLDIASGKVPKGTSVSLKLSGLGQRLNEARCNDLIEKLVRLADEHGIFITLDMESSHTTAKTIGTYMNLHKKGLHRVRLVLQSRLRRTTGDISNLVFSEQPFENRLCIGIYDEAKWIALTSKVEMKEILIEHGRTILLAGRKVEFATHDHNLLLKLHEMVEDLIQNHGVNRNQVEFSMLYGVPIKGGVVDMLIAKGYVVRIYVPYGKHWRAYGERRIAARPIMIWYILWHHIKAIRF